MSGETSRCAVNSEPTTACGAQFSDVLLIE